MSTNDWLTNTGVVVKASDRLDQRLQREGTTTCRSASTRPASTSEKCALTSEKYTGEILVAELIISSEAYPNERMALR